MSWCPYVILKGKEYHCWASGEACSSNPARGCCFDPEEENEEEECEYDHYTDEI